MSPYATRPYGYPAASPYHHYATAGFSPYSHYNPYNAYNAFNAYNGGYLPQAAGYLNRLARGYKFDIHILLEQYTIHI